MADRNLIAGAAALAQSQAAKSLGFGAGLAQEATRIAGDIMKREEERKAQVKNDMNLAAQFISKMASTGTASGQYKSILTSEAMATKNRLNEIALDQSLNAVEKAAEYTKAVDEYNVLASTYAGDQEKLIALQSVVRAGDYSNTVNRDTEEFQIARALGTGDYEIVKDGYMVNGKKITSAELNNYIGLYKPKNIEKFAIFDGQLRNNIRQAKGNKSYENSILSEAKNIPIEQKLNYLVDYKNQAYSNFVNKNNELNEDSINAVYDKLLNDLRKESSVEPLVSLKTVDPSSHQGRANRYIESAQTLKGLEDLLNEALPGAWQRNGNIISFYAGNTKKNPVTKEMEPVFDSQAADVSTPEGVKAVLKLAATTEYGSANGSKINDYIRQEEILGYDFSVDQLSAENNNDIINTKLSDAEIDTKRSRWIASVSENEFSKSVTFGDSFTKAGKPTGKIRNEEVQKESFKEKYPNYPAEIYGQENIFGKGDTKALEKRNKKLEKKIVNNKEKIIKVLRNDPDFDEQAEIIFRNIEGVENYLEFLKSYDLSNTDFENLNLS
jgi:hypothetical protein